MVSAQVMSENAPQAESEKDKMSALSNVVVVGGSYVGLTAAKELANILPATHRVILIEPHSHFHHLFAFPRFSILPSHEHKAFIPYTSTYTSSPDPSRHLILHARATALHPHTLTVDRPIFQSSTSVPFDYLILATGSKLPPPGNIPLSVTDSLNNMTHHGKNEKENAARYLRQWQSAIKQADTIVLVGGGAVGVQMACDIKEIYPHKQVTIVHSRDRLMNAFHPWLGEIVDERLRELGVRVEKGVRVVFPEGGFPDPTTTTGSNSTPKTNMTEVRLTDGRCLKADLFIPCTGPKPSTSLLTSPSSTLPAQELINPENGCIRVRPTMQLAHEKLSHLFAIGDVADTGMHKAARPGMVQAGVAARNILAMVEGREAREVVKGSPGGIHLTLGLTRSVLFRNPNITAGETEPYAEKKEDGAEDMHIAMAWARRGVKVMKVEDFHL